MNVIDALAIVLVLVTAASMKFIFTAVDSPNQTDSDATNTTQATVQLIEVQPFIADGISAGATDSDAVVAVENKSVRPRRLAVHDQNGTVHVRNHPWKKTVTLRLSHNTTTTEDEVLFSDEPLEVGRKLNLNLGSVTTSGVVTSVGFERE